MYEIENEAWLIQNYYLFSSAQITCFQAVIERLLTRNGKRITLGEARNKALDVVLKCQDF